MLRSHLLISVMLGLGLVLGGCGFGGSGTAASTTTSAPVVVESDIEEGVSKGQRLPDVEFLTFAGDKIRLSEMRGQPLIVNFWATWCGPCRQEIPLLQEAYDKHRSDGLRLIAVTDETQSVVEPFVQENSMTFPIMFDERGRVGNKYRIQSIPTTFFLDSNGVIVARQIGSLDEATLQSFLNKLFQTPNAPAPTERPALPPTFTPPAIPLRERIG